MSFLLGFRKAPTVMSVTPSSGVEAGGTVITDVQGQYFYPGATVRIDGVLATSVARVSSIKLTCVTPASGSGPGVKNVLVTNPDGRDSGTSGNGLFTYVAAPVVTGVTPSTDVTTGGVSTSIAGTGFVNGATATIGGASVGSLTFVSSIELTGTAPSGTVGARNVVVTNPDAQTSGTSGNGLFTYTLAPAAPVVIAIVPATGTNVGSTHVVIEVDDSTGATSAAIDGVNLTGFAIDDATHVSGNTVAHPVGAVDVTVTNGVGTSAPLVGGFTYAPVVIAIVPTTGTDAGSTHVVIEVDDSTGATSAALDGVNLTGFAIDNATHVSGNTVAHLAGAVDVTVTNGGGTSAPLVGGFTYTAAPGLVAAILAPVSVTYDGTYLWTSAKPTAGSDVDGHIVQKFDPSLPTPGVVATVDVSAYSNGGEGIDVLNPAPVRVAVRQIRSDGTHVFACVQSGKNLNTNIVSGFCVIIDPTTDTIVGHVKFTSINTTDRTADCRAVTFDGAGNFFAVQASLNGAAGDHVVHKFSIASVISAYPAYGTPTFSSTVGTVWTDRLEDIVYGGGYLWAVRGITSVPSGLMRMDPTTGAFTTYAFSSPYDTHWTHSLLFAFGSVWATIGGAANALSVLRFDPATFPSAPIAVLSISPGSSNALGGGMSLESDGTYLWLSNAGGNSRRLTRFSTGLGTEARVSTLTSLITSDRWTAMAFDGTNLWALSRFGVQPSLSRVSMGVGTETFDFSIENGD